MKVLIVSHGHPDEHPGGAEIAAYTLFQSLNQLECVNAYFIARTNDPSHNRPGTQISTFMDRPNELLFYSSESDDFLFSRPAAAGRDDFAGVVERLQPDVVHFHHYVHVGVEAIAIVRRVCPQCRILVTLHEFLAICNNHGQMVKTKSLALCTEASPAMCARCYPKRTSSDFFLRQHFIRSHFEKVDQFISPSEFLRQRYVDRGIPEGKITVLENLLPPLEPAPPRPLVAGERRSVFAYFGQINAFKGIRVLVQAFELLENWDRTDDIRLLIFGSSRHAGAEFQDWFDKALERNRKRISYQGAYRHESMPELMGSVDWVVMASLWWENSPVVIREAFGFGRPVICANIGGMAEKVTAGVNGLHFHARNSFSLADTIRFAVARKDRWQRLASGAGKTSTPDVTDKILDMYAGAGKAPSGTPRLLPPVLISDDGDRVRLSRAAEDHSIGSRSGQIGSG